MFVTVLMTYMIKFNVETTYPTQTIEATVFPKVATEFYSLTTVDAMDVRQTYSDVDSFVEDVIVSGKPWASGVPEVLTGSHVFVCAHANRDKRCGVCGPVLIEKFEEEIETRGLKDQVFVRAYSHIGGQKYAGREHHNFQSRCRGKNCWSLIWLCYSWEQHIGKGEIIDRL